MAVKSTLVAESVDITRPLDFPQNGRFSPDGLCVLTATQNQFGLYNTHTTPEWKASLTAKTGDSVRNFAWYPTMQSDKPASCCWIAAVRDQPIHLYDAYTGSVRTSYCPYNGLDEMESPNVVAFSGNGEQIIAGGFRTDRILHVFDTAQPGKFSTTLRLGKTRHSKDGQKGIVSALDTGSSDISGNLCVVGTYAPGSLYLYDLRAGQQASGTLLDGFCISGHGKNHAKKTVFAGDDWIGVEKHKWFQSKTRGGVTQVHFQEETYQLYTTSRRSDAVLCWDLRMLSDNPEYAQTPLRGVASFETVNPTNQRLDFCIHSDRLYVGGYDRTVRVYDLKTHEELSRLEDLPGVVNGVSVTTTAQNQILLAASCGSRQFPTDDDLMGDRNQITDATPGCLQLYKLEQE